MEDAAKSLCDGSGSYYEFSYSQINGPSALEAFQPNAGGAAPRKAYKLEDGYDYFFMNACDGSDGRMSVCWGQQGEKKGSMSGGLN